MALTESLDDARASAPTAVAQSGIVALGGHSRIHDDCFTWRDRSTDGRWEWFNSYVLPPSSSGAAATVVDAGPAAFTTDILAGPWAPALGGGVRTLVQTRLEPDVLSGLPDWIAAAGGADLALFAPGAGGLEPLDMFEDLNARLIVERAQVDVTLVFGGNELSLPGGRVVDVIAPAFRTLSTRWYFDRETATLFTSDAFSHYAPAIPEARVVTDATESEFLPAGMTLTEATGRHHCTKFDWLEVADVAGLTRDLAQVFAAHDVQRICPSRGGVIEGAALVERNVDALISALNDLGEVRGDLDGPSPTPTPMLGSSA